MAEAKGQAELERTNEELHKRAPSLFHKSIVTVDLVDDSAEEVLQTITGAFASAGGGLTTPST